MPDFICHFTNWIDKGREVLWLDTDGGLMMVTGKCEMQCEGCAWGEKNIKAGKWQNIFVHATNDLDN